MKFCIFGSGAVGSYFGGRLAQAGHDVTFLARGKHLEAIATNGLKVKSINGNFDVFPAKATDRTDQIGVVDVVLCCVKSWQVPDAAKAMGPLIGPETVVVPLQNGVEAHAILSERLGVDHVLPGLCKIITMVESPGHIRHAGADPILTFGEIDGCRSSRTIKISQAFSEAQGMTAHVSENIFSQLWRKFMLIAPWGGLGALTRSPIGVIRNMPETRQLLLASIREVYDVARSNKITMTPKSVDDTIAFIDQLPADGTASMQRDIMNGRPSELREQNGAVMRFGERGRIDTPVNRFIYYSLLPLERKAREDESFG